MEGQGAPWRTDALIEYWGSPFGPYGQGDNAFKHPPLYKGPSFSGYVVDETNNTWSCLRTLLRGQTSDDNGAAAAAAAAVIEDSLYCVFWATYADVETPGAKPYFAEHYDLSSDPWQLNNTVAALSEGDHARLSKRLEHLRHCRGLADCT